MASLSYSPLPVFVLLLLLIFSTATTGEPSTSSEIKLVEEKMTHILFYLRAIPSGPKATEVKVGQGPSQLRPVLNFGDVMVFDDALMEGPSPTSKLVGRAQGTYSIATLGEPAFFMAMNFVFSEGKYNGSTLAVLGNNPFTRKLREIPVVGGTGKLRLARGYVLTSTYMFNSTTGETIARYDVYVARS